MSRVLLVCLIASLAVAHGKAQSDSAAMLVEQLGSNSAAERESAASRLRELGTQARVQLAKGCEHRNAQVRRTAFALLNRLPGTRYRAKRGASIDSLTGLPKAIVHRASGCEMVLIPAGTYMRGAGPIDAMAEPRERPQKRAAVARPFYLGRCELTYGQWRAVMGPKKGVQPEPATPVVDVSMDEIRSYLWRTGLRLPTETEWEFACRAGHRGARYGPMDKIAWYYKNSGNKLHDVGELRPNRFGLHDMIGNAFEFCGDVCLPDGKSRTPTSSTLPDRHAIRGGAFNYGLDWGRASARWPCEPGVHSPHIGFRVALDP
ncbi:MAG: SUMF1/EgtB/PvdO family nonheme iron enzyme [Planctomycetota bacterium]